jgi:hypothetical protein
MRVPAVGIFTPILDSEKHPITAGGFVKTVAIIFQDMPGDAQGLFWKRFVASSISARHPEKST